MTNLTDIVQRTKKSIQKMGEVLPKREEIEGDSRAYDVLGNLMQMPQTFLDLNGAGINFENDFLLKVNANLDYSDKYHSLLERFPNFREAEIYSRGEINQKLKDLRKSSKSYEGKTEIQNYIESLQREFLF